MIAASNVRLWMVPDNRIPVLKDAYEKEEWLFLLQQWNKLNITSDNLCTCSSGIETLKHYLPRLWTTD